MQKLNLLVELENALLTEAVNNFAVTFEAPSVLFKDPEYTSKLEEFLNGGSVNRAQSLKDAFRRSAVLDRVGKITIGKGGKISVEVKEEPSRNLTSLLERVYVNWVKDLTHLANQKYRSDVDVFFGKAIALDKLFVITKNPSKLISTLEAILSDEAAFIPNIAVNKMEAKSGFLCVYLDSEIDPSKYLEVASDAVEFIGSNCSDYDTKAAAALYRFLRAKIVIDVNAETGRDKAVIQNEIAKALLDDDTPDSWRGLGVKNTTMIGYLRDQGYAHEQIKFVSKFVQSGY